MKKYLLIMGLIALLLGTFQTIQAAPTLQGSGLPVLPECDSKPELIVCEEAWEWELADLQARSDDLWSEGETLYIVKEVQADGLFMSGGISTLLRPVLESELFAVAIHVDDLEKAAFTYLFIPIVGRSLSDPLGEAAQWRGPDAPARPAQNDPLQGEIQHITIHSTALDAERPLTIYMPPGHDASQSWPVVYLADGEFVEALAAEVDFLITEGQVPPLLLVGVNSAPYEARATGDLRAAEYLDGWNLERFAAHQEFFTQEVAAWAESTLGASQNREERAVFGLSNGAAFAVSMGMQYPERFGHVMAFSYGWELDLQEPDARFPVDYYLVAGTLEEHFHTTTLAFYERLQEAGIEAHFTERVANHDPLLWTDEFPGALRAIWGD